MSAIHASLLPRVAPDRIDLPRLWARLDEWVPVTVIRGPSGHGKTTLVAAWAEGQCAAGATVVWVTAAPSLDDRSDFGRCLSRSLSATGDASFDSMVSTDAAAGNGGLAELNLALLQKPLDRKFVLVIDNFQYIHDEQLVRDLLGLVERHRHFHLYVCCRGRHRIETMAGPIKVCTIDANELRLDVHEIVTLSEVMGHPVTLGVATTLFEDLGGNSAMIRMALGATEEGVPRPNLVKEYLWTTVFPEIDPTLLGHLMWIALAEHIEWQVFRELCGADHPDQLLADLEATGMLIRVPTGAMFGFVVPRPICEILQDFFHTNDPVGAKNFHRRLARWYVEHNAPFAHDALRHAVAGEDWELLDHIWATEIVSPVDIDPASIRGILADLPAEVIAARPSMLVVREALQQASAEASSLAPQALLEAYAQASERTLKANLDVLGLSDLTFLGTGYLVALRAAGRLQDSVAFGDFLLGRMKQISKTHPAPVGRLGWFHLQRGITSTVLHDDRSAKLAYHRSAAQSDGCVASVQSSAAAHLALSYAMEGDTENAKLWLERHWSLPHLDNGFGPLVEYPGHLAAGILALDRLDVTETAHQLEILDDGAVNELWPFVAFLHAQHALHTGRAGEALIRLNQIRTDHELELTRNGVAVALITRARADLLIAAGEGRRAKFVLDAQPNTMPSNRIALYRIHALGGTDSASWHIDPLTWDPATTTRDRLEMLLLHAAAAWRGADERNALRLMHQALEIYEYSMILRPFATIARRDLTELLALAEFEMEPDDLALLSGQQPIYPEHLEVVALSSRELSVLAALGQHHSRQDIADSLYVSVNTVKSQLASIYKKLGTSNREETLVKARVSGLLP